MKIIFIFGIFILLSFTTRVCFVEGAGRQLLQEIVGADQRVTHQEGLPVIISQKYYGIAIIPESLFTEQKKSIQFTLVINNPSEEPLKFSGENVKVYTGKKDLALLKSEDVIEEARKEYSKEALKLTKDQEKALSPYVEDQMQRLRDRLLKNQIIPPKEEIRVLIAVKVPTGMDRLTIKIITPKDEHQFSFYIIEL